MLKMSSTPILKKPSTWLVVIGLVITFAAGVLLRGPISGGTDWCRDVDYGNLPQWVALVLGGVVAGFTIFGILTARTAYRDDVRAREYAQARLVYAEVFTVGYLSGLELDQDYKEPGTRTDFVVFGGGEAGPAAHCYRDLENRRLRVIPQLEVPFIVIGVRVFNRSNELIAEAQPRLQFADEVRTYESSQRRTVSPGKWTDTVFVLTDVNGRGPVSTTNDPRSFSVTVGFTDATGIRWTREEAQPVTMVPST